MLAFLLCSILFYFQESVNVEAFEQKASVRDEKKISETVLAELAAYINTLTLDDVLEDFGGRSVLEHVLKADYHVLLDSDQDSVDAYLLDEAFQEIKDHKETFIEIILSSFEEYQQEYPSEEMLIEEIRKDIPSILLVKSYFNTWYDISIKEQNLGEQLFIKNKSVAPILAISESIKKDPTYLKSTGTVRFYLDVLGPIFGFETVSEQIESFIQQETGSTNYSEWFEGYFGGELIDIPSSHPELQWEIWDKLKENKSNLLPLLTLKEPENMVIASTDTLIIYSSKNNYGDNYRETFKLILSNFTHYLDTLLKTHPKEADRILKGLTIATVYDAEHNHEGFSNYLEPKDSLSRFYNRINFYTQITSHSGAQAAGPRIEFARDYLDNEGGGTLAHEYSHVTLPLLGNVPNTDFGYRIKGDAETISSRIFGQWYENDGVNFILFQNPVTWDTANSADRFKQSTDLQEYFGGYTSLIYVLNNAIAEYVLSLPISDQVGYIRKWDAEENTIRTLSEQEIRTLNFKGTDDLVDHNIGIYDKSVRDGDVPTNYMGSSFYSFDSQFFVEASGDMPDRHSFSIQLFDELMGLETYEGWEAPYLFFLKQTDVETNLEALQIVLSDPTIDFKQFRKNQLSRTYEQVKEKGLKTFSYSELLQLIETNKSNFRRMKQDLYREYLSITNEFKESIYGEDEKLTVGTEISLSESVITIGEEVTASYSLNPSKEASQIRVEIELPEGVQINQDSLQVKNKDEELVNYEVGTVEQSKLVLLLSKLENEVTISHDMMGVNTEEKLANVHLSIFEEEQLVGREESTIEINQGSIGLILPNKLPFESVQLTGLPTNQLIHRKSEDWLIKVADYRGKQVENQMTQWRIEGIMTSEFIGNQTIPVEELSVVFKQNEESQSLGKENVELYAYNQKTEIPEYDYETNTWRYTDTTIEWEKEEGLLVQVSRSLTPDLTGSYEVALELGLVLAP